jgi:beta-lactamase class A
MPLIRLALLVALVLLPACAPAAAQAGSNRASTDTAALRRTIENAAAGYQGIVGVSVRNLATGESLSIRGGETFSSASLIKVAVLIALLDEVQKGTMRLDEPLSMLARDRVGGSGVLQHLHPGLQLTVEDAARLMIIISDNTATNLLLEKLNIRTVWTKMEALGLPHTKIHSKSFNRASSVAMDSSVKYGLGVTTPDETVELFARLHAGTAVSPRLDSVALAILRENDDWNKLTRWLPAGARAAHKSGDVDQARNDCGILYGPDAPVALCVMTRENQDRSYATDNPANLLIARIGAEVYRHYNPSAPPPAIPR